MKKLSILLIACITCVVTQAATYSWSVNVNIDSAYTVSSVSVYYTETLTLNATTIANNASTQAAIDALIATNTNGLLDDVIAQNQAKLIADSQTGSFGLTYQGASGAASVFSGAAEQLAKTSTTDSAKVDYYVVVEYKDGDNKDYSWQSDPTSYNAKIGDLITNQMISGEFTVNTENIPEPTSGLLLLCGLAGLALRRKRA